MEKRLKMKTIFKNNEIMIKTDNNGTFCYLGSIRCDLTSTTLTPKQAAAVAPLIVGAYKRGFQMGWLEGHEKGKDEGKAELKNAIKNLFN